MNAPFNLDAFLSQVEQAATRQQVLLLLRELERHCASMAFDECKQLSGLVADRMSQRLNQLPA